MESFKVEDVIIHKNLLRELIFLQTGCIDPNTNYDNSGIKEKCDALQDIGDFLIKIAGQIDETEKPTVLDLLQDIMYLKQSFHNMRALVSEKEGGKS